MMFEKFSSIITRYRAYSTVDSTMRLRLPDIGADKTVSVEARRKSQTYVLYKDARSKCMQRGHGV